MKPGNEEGYSEVTEEVIRLCRLKAMHLLEYADRTEAQLRKKLEEGGFPPSAVQEALDYARSFHYIDDRRFAESYVRVHSSSRSRLQLKKALSDKGVSREIVDEVLEEAEIDETENIRRQFIKKYGSSDLSDRKTYEKAFRYFSSKGYGYNDIRTALVSALTGQEDD